MMLSKTWGVWFKFVGKAFKIKFIMAKNFLETSVKGDWLKGTWNSGYSGAGELLNTENCGIFGSWVEESPKKICNQYGYFF